MGSAEVTVVLTCGPAEHLFDEAVASVGAQTVAAACILFHDVAGTSSYRRKIERAARRLPNSIISSPPSRSGVGEVPDVLRRISTPYVAFLDDAAAYYPAKLAVGIAAMQREASYVLTGVEQGDEAPDPSGAAGRFDPTGLVAGLFGLGPRTHRSTLMMKTSLALDPEGAAAMRRARWEDALIVRLLLDRDLKGRLLPSRLTALHTSPAASLPSGAVAGRTPRSSNATCFWSKPPWRSEPASSGGRISQPSA